MLPKPKDYDDAARDLLGEDVRACAPCSRTRGLSALALSQVSGAAGIAQAMRGKKKAGDLPQMFLAAVTDGHLHLLAQPKVRWNPKPKATAVLVSFPLAATNLTTSKAVGGIKLTIAAHGSTIEIQTAGGDTGARLVEALRAG